MTRIILTALILAGCANNPLKQVNDAPIPYSPAALEDAGVSIPDTWGNVIQPREVVNTRNNRPPAKVTPAPVEPVADPAPAAPTVENSRMGWVIVICALLYVIVVFIRPKGDRKWAATS